MDRRAFNAALAAASVLGLVAPTAARAQGAPARPRIGMLVYSDMILLDLAGPLTAFNIMQADIQLIARSSQAVMTDVGLPVTPTANFETTAKD